MDHTKKTDNTVCSDTNEVKEYSTDGKVRHFSTEEDINQKLIKIIGKKFEEYRIIDKISDSFSLESMYLISFNFFEQ